MIIPPLVDPVVQPSVAQVIEIREQKQLEHDNWVAEQKRLAEEKRKAEAELARKIAEHKALLEDMARTAARMGVIGSANPGTYVRLQCTWYVGSRVQVPLQMGNADLWDTGLLRAGWRTGPARRGAVGVSIHGMHVVLVEHINPDGTVHISEYNHKPRAYSERDVPATGKFQWFYL